MATIRQVYENWKGLDVLQETAQELIGWDEEIIELNKSQLLDDGEDSEGVKLKEYSDYYYANRKHKRNPSPGFGVPDLYDKGDFYDGFKMKLNNKKSYDIFSTDSKNNKLVKQYGKKIFGLNWVNRLEFIRDIFREALIERIKKKVNL